MAVGVFAGARMPCQILASKPGTPDSAIVGTPGTRFERRMEVMPSARTLPAFAMATEVDAALKTICNWPATVSESDWATPL